jgi:hypothetical protein
MNPMKPALPLLAILLAAGCTLPPSAAPGGAPGVPPGHLVRRAGGSNAIDALVSGNEITGAEISVTRYLDPSDHSIRGTAFGNPVDVTVTDTKASGLFASAPVDITTSEIDGKMHVEGMMRGQPSTFDFSADILDGKIGICEYHLKWTGRSYQGSRGCGGGGVVEVEVPQALRVWSKPEIAMALGLFLASP